MRPSALVVLVLAACVLAAAGCARKKGFERPGFAYGCPIGEAKVSSMEDLIQAKTASLLAGACEVGALRAEPGERVALRGYGEALGMAFQIVDDLLDYVGDPSITGKPRGSDLREHKVTLPLIAALPRMDGTGRKQVDALMDSPEPEDAQIADVIAAVAKAGGFDYARERALRLAQQADGELDALPPSPARDALRDAITYVVDRRR